MKFLKIVLATAAMTGFASTAAAQGSNVYINIGVDAIEFDAYTLSGKLGYKFSQNFAIEAQAGFGIADQSVGGFDVGVDNTFGAFAVASLPVGENFELFARAGYHFTTFGVSGGNINADLSSDGFAVGAGGQYFFTEQDGIRAEYTYLDVNTNGAGNLGGGNVFSVSYVRNF
jgi:opacity protein-like surface antigen